MNPSTTVNDRKRDAIYQLMAAIRSLRLTKLATDSPLMMERIDTLIRETETLCRRVQRMST